MKLKVIRWSVGLSVCLSVCQSQLNVFLYNTYTISQIETKINVRVDINDGKIFLEGKGYWIKGQGQTRAFVEYLFGLYILFCWLYWHKIEYIC